ncbi:MAG TPA: hypothetical protein VIY73_04185 [Polyangiaceae bacterium]
MAFRALACAEFPNDNPELHAGAIWYCAELVGPPVWERPRACEPEVEAVGAAAAAVAPASEPATDPTPPVLEADDAEDDLGFEIVDELPIEDPIDESPGLPEALAAPVTPESEVAAHDEPAREASDPFATFVTVVEDVARTAGAGIDAMTLLAAILGRARLDASACDTDRSLREQALAWQAILRGESEDFAACGGGMLDEWTAGLLAHVLTASGGSGRTGSGTGSGSGSGTGTAHRADGLKRELRRHGVAAFGLVEQAA